MNSRQRVAAILHYQEYDRLPVVHFGYWAETLAKWADEGHLTQDEIAGVTDGSESERLLSAKLGFDFNWYVTVADRTGPLCGIYPPFEQKVIEQLPGGLIKTVNEYGVIAIEDPNSPSIPSEVDHLLKDRQSWEELFKPRLQFTEDRIDGQMLADVARHEDEREDPLGVFCGSMYGQIRNMMGLEAVSYLHADDEAFYDEMIDTVGLLNYRVTERLLASDIRFDFGHFWEDICFNFGPLVPPDVFQQKVVSHYRKITDLLGEHGIDIVSVDCDGKVDALIPAWLDGGVNTMFPIEVGTWNTSIQPWRNAYGKQLRGIGGMNKNVFSRDYAAIDQEIERLKPLVELGGYIPCPDHRIAPDAKWENVQYYCDRMRETF